MKAVKNLFILIGLFLLSQVGMTVFSVVKIYYLEAGEPRIPAMMSYGLIALLLANIGLLMYLARKLGLATFDFGWSTKRNWLWIIGGFVLGRVVAVGGTMYLQHISDQEATANDALLGELFTGENPLLIFVLIAVAAPIMEEIVFRGGFIGLLFKKYPIVGIISSVAVFSIIHSVTNLVEFLIYGAMGLIMALIYVKTKRLETAIAMHFLNNALAAIAMILLG